MVRNLVTVTNTDINTHTQTQEQLYLKRNWSVNAARRLNYTLGTKLLYATTQRIAVNVLSAK
jgi:hypothetical protein